MLPVVWWCASARLCHVGSGSRADQPQQGPHRGRPRNSRSSAAATRTHSTHSSSSSSSTARQRRTTQGRSRGRGGAEAGTRAGGGGGGGKGGGGGARQPLVCASKGRRCKEGERVGCLRCDDEAKSRCSDGHLRRGLVVALPLHSSSLCPPLHPSLLTAAFGPPLFCH